MLKHERRDVLAMDALRLDICRAAANQIAHSFMAFVRHPYRSKLARAQQPSQSDLIPGWSSPDRLGAVE